MVATILIKADKLEEEIRQVLSLVKEDESVQYFLRDLNDDVLLVPLLVDLFQEEGWLVEYDCEDQDDPDCQEWLTFHHPSVKDYEKDDANTDDITEGYDYFLG